MKKGIILARVSTQEQQETGLSLDKIQLPQLRQYAIDNGFTVAPEHEFVFQETASQKLRKKFDEMVQKIKNNDDIQAIISFRVDRLTRNYRDAVEMDNLRIEHGKELHFVSDRLILTAKSFGRDIQDWDLKVFLAKQHINRCQEDTHNTFMSKLKNQEIYGKAPFGYENYEDEHKRRSARTKPFEAGIVKKIFDLYTTGAYSYLQISKIIENDFKINFHKSKVEKTIKNPFYMGFREYENELYPHKYERIITKEIWDIAESIRNGRKPQEKKGKLKGKNGAYRGLMYCKQCGCSITPEKHVKKQKNGNINTWTYYHCTGSKGKHKDVWIEEKELTKQFAKIYKHMKVPEVELENMVKTLRESHDGKIKFNEEVFDHCNSEIKKREKRIEDAYIDKLDGGITRDVYDNLRKRFRKEQDEFKEKLARLERADEEYYITVSYLLELASRSYELFTGSEPDEKREIIQLTLLNLY